MLERRRMVLALTFSAAIAACSCGDDEAPQGGGSGGASGGGGNAATGGAAAGGKSATGGAAVGGASSGGSSAGGASTGGGGTQSGGTASSGGVTGSGGVTTPVDGGAGGSGPVLPATAIVYASGTQNGQGRIVTYRLTFATGALESLGQVNAGQNAAFLTIDVPRKRLYAADESASRVRSYRLDADWAPVAVNDVAATGNPVHIAVTSDGKFVLTAQYNEAKVESFPVDANGSLGSSLGAKSTGGQAHAAVLSPDERFAFVPCKAADRIESYTFDKGTGALGDSPAQTPTAGGAGPRHFAFHPGGAFAYLVNELNNTVYAYSYVDSTGALTELQRIGTLPSGAGASTGAEIVVSPNGKDVYSSNRLSGQNGSIAMFRVGTDGKLTANGHQTTGGRIPRSFAIDPTGRFVIAANQDSRSLGVMAVDASTGKLGAPKMTSDIGLSPSYVGIIAP